jgi:hypothetical protein
MKADKEKNFDWPLCYEAEQLILQRLDTFLARNTFAKRLSDRILTGTGTLLIDWVDHLIVPASDRASLGDLGFIPDPLGQTDGGLFALWHPEALLPRVLVASGESSTRSPIAVAIRVDGVADFLAAQRISTEPEGEPLARFRRAMVSNENGATMYAIERRGYRGYKLQKPSPDALESLLKAHELWKTRPRQFDNDADGFRQTHALLDRIIALVGRDLACHVVFWEERAYWQSRNRAAQVQKARQDDLGLGWANHDHHTFRCSRRHFLDLMRAIEKLGFERRERYYAGAQAGWGAQILEHPVEGIVTFCDVDLEPDETAIDFSRKLLPQSKKLGTIGLWVGLHGESFLEAGMHHLECRFDYELLRDQLAALDVNTMKPFSDFPFLKQAFTQGERWTVRPERARRLLENGSITQEQFRQFATEGAIGSHLENLQRKGGFKGFNQTSVSAIIHATDPRLQIEHAQA